MIENTKKQYNYIAFDLDGTLTDPENGLIEGFKYAFKKLGLDYSDREALRKYIGPSLYKEWQADFGFTPEEANNAIEIFREYYNIYGWWDNKIYDGVREMLHTLKNSGKVILLATSKPLDTAKKILELFDLTKYFDFIGGADSIQLDQKWKILEHSLTSIGIAKDSPKRAECILVGDRCFDSEGAKICSIDCLGVSYGHGTREELEASDFTYLCDSPWEVTELLL